MRSVTARAALLVATSLLVACSAVVAQAKGTDEEPKRLGRNKKKVDGRVYASYGLSPHAASPRRSVDYSKAAVKAASSAAKKPAAAASSSSKPGKKKRINLSSSSSTTTGGGEPSAPGTQAKVDLRPYMSAVEDQSQSNSCAANAVAGAYEYLATRAALRDGEETVGEISRLFIYFVGRKRDQMNWGENVGLKPKDEGMSLGGGIEAVQTKGAALQSSWPFDLTKVNARPTEEAFDEAMRYKVGDAMVVPLDLDRMRQCLSDGYPIVFGLKLTAAFFRPPYGGYIPTPDPSDPRSAEHGLHAMLLVGYNDRQRVFVVRNSWGKDWGVDGYCYLSYDYVANEEFNFVGMYAIQSLTDDDLTPDDDDGHDIDMDDAVDGVNQTPHVELELDDHYDLVEPDEEEDDLDAEDMFDSRADARRAFVRFAGDGVSLSADNLQLSKAELKSALLLMGIPMLTDEEVDVAFKRYDDDRSGFINFEEFLDMQELFDGSLIHRQRSLNKLKKRASRLVKKAKKFFSGGSTAEIKSSEL